MRAAMGLQTLTYGMPTTAQIDVLQIQYFDFPLTIPLRHLQGS